MISWATRPTPSRHRASSIGTAAAFECAGGAARLRNDREHFAALRVNDFDRRLARGRACAKATPVTAGPRAGIHAVDDAADDERLRGLRRRARLFDVGLRLQLR